MLKYETVYNGKDEWCVFVHGIGGSTRTWKKQISDFSNKYNLLLLDLPGHGENADTIIYSVDDDLLNNGIKDTLDHLRIKQAHFIGLSLGTIVIAQFALKFPAYIKSLIFGGAALKVCGIYKSIIRFANNAKEIIPYKMMYKLFAWFMMPKENHKKSRRIFVREVEKLNNRSMFAWIEYLKFTLYPEKIMKKLDRLGKRILFVSGDEDHCFLKGSRELADMMDSAEIAIIEKCGHVCSIEKSDLFNRQVLNYLAA